MKDELDIQSRTDIESIIDAFYGQALKDDVIGYLFTEVAQLVMEEHFPRIVDFWESVLLGEAKYQGNPILKHIHLHQMSPLRSEHFDQWLLIWEQTVRHLFEGHKADEAISKAKMMAELMLYKISASEKNGFVQ